MCHQGGHLIMGPNNLADFVCRWIWGSSVYSLHPLCGLEASSPRFWKWLTATIPLTACMYQAIIIITIPSPVGQQPSMDQKESSMPLPKMRRLGMPNQQKIVGQPQNPPSGRLMQQQVCVCVYVCVHVCVCMCVCACACVCARVVWEC